MSEKMTKTEAAKPTAPAKAAEAVYEVREFAGNAEKIFGRKANADLVTAAFKISGKTKATLSEAKDIVGKFMSKEVK